MHLHSSMIIIQKMAAALAGVLHFHIIGMLTFISKIENEKKQSF